MPELPEAEVVRRGLARNLSGLTVKQVEIWHPRSIRGTAEAEFQEFLPGWTVHNVVRRGKFLWLLGTQAEPARMVSAAARASDRKFTPSRALLIHLGMSGQCLVNPAERELAERTARHLRIRLTFTEGTTLNFVDQRTFGRMGIEPLLDTGDGQAGGQGSDLPKVPLCVGEKIARDCLDPALDLESVITRLKARSAPIKNILLDQSVVSGLGNIYADEALFKAGVHPLATPKRLAKRTLRRVYQQAAETMQAALAQGGTSFDALYVNTEGDPGYFARSLAVYGRRGQPCLVCGAPLQQIMIAKRSATFCPSCQR